MSAEGESLVDLLDNYLKACVKDKKIEPFGGVLYDQYNYAWNPPGTIFIWQHSLYDSFTSLFTDFDMNVLQERLKEQKRMREKAALGKTPPSQRKDQYTPIEIDTGSEEPKMSASTTESEGSSGEGAFRRSVKKQLPPTPVKPKNTHSSSTSEGETTPKKKPLPPPPAKKPTEPPISKSAPKREDTSATSTPNQSLIQRMNQPLPPTPNEESQPSPNMQPAGRRFKPTSPSTPQATGSELLKEMMAKTGKGSLDRANPKKKQPVPVPKQRPPSKKSTPAGDSAKPLRTVPANSSLTPEQLHEPAGYANLPVHDTPYQNMGFGPDASAQPQESEPDALYENVHKGPSNRKLKSGRTDSPGARAKKTMGYMNVKVNGSGSTGGSEYQNTNASRRPRP